MQASTFAEGGENRLVCLVCHKQFSLYTCPRCNVRYCSLSCYRSHSSRCLESFNRDNVLANLQDCDATPDTRRKMLEVLQRFHFADAAGAQHEDAAVDDDARLLDQDADDDRNEWTQKPCILSEETLNKLALGQDIQPSDLSREEEKAFLRAVTSGEFSHLIKPWEPWWLSPFAKEIVLNKDGNRAVQPIEQGETPLNAEGTDAFDVPPPLDSPLPPVRHLLPKPPSPFLGVHLSEVLYSYCFTLRFFNGEWTWDAFNAALTLMNISRVLGQSASPETVREALGACFETICSPFFKSSGGFKFAVALLDDAIALLHIGRAGAVCALSDLHRMLNEAAKAARHGGGRESALGKTYPRRNVPVEGGKAKASISKDLKAVTRKVFFLLCWVNEQSAEVFSTLAIAVENEKAHILATQEPIVSEIQTKSCSRKPLVEEMSDTSLI